MLFSMFILTILSIFIGYIFFDAFLGIGSLFFSNSIFILNFNYSILDAEFSLYYIKFLSLIFMFFGISLGFILYTIIYNNSYYIIFNVKLFYYIYYFFNKALYFDYILNNYFLNYILKLSYFNIYKYIEKGIFELFGPFFILNSFIKVYYFFNYFNKGLIYDYIFIIL